MQELRRSLPLLVQAVEALLHFMVAAELAASLAALLPDEPRRAAATAADVPAWRVRCAEGLAHIMSEIAALKVSVCRRLACCTSALTSVHLAAVC